MGSSSFLGTAASLSFSRIVLLPGSVVIHDLHVVGVAFLPAEADPPLVVDPNAVLPGSVPFQRLQLIAGRGGKVPQRSRAMQIEELASGRAFDGLEAGYRPIAEEHLRFLALVGLDHGSRLFSSAYYVSHYRPPRSIHQGLGTQEAKAPREGRSPSTENARADAPTMLILLLPRGAPLRGRTGGAGGPAGRRCSGAARVIEETRSVLSVWTKVTSASG